MIETLQQELEHFTGRKLKLRINDNRSTMLSVCWEPGCTKLSLHRMFLGAPKNVMESLACYLRNGQSQSLPLPVKTFIERQMQKLDYSHQVKKQCLETKGRVFDLQEVLDKLNREYFDDTLKLQITWYGMSNRKFRSRINFGLYSDPLKLIKIHRILDRTEIPDFFLEFVVYHEMLHNVCLPFVADSGNTVIHTPEFKAREQQFARFSEASAWLEEYKHRFFE